MKAYCNHKHNRALPCTRPHGNQVFYLGAFCVRTAAAKPGYPLQVLAVAGKGSGLSASIPCAAGKVLGFPAKIDFRDAADSSIAARPNRGYDGRMFTVRVEAEFAAAHFLSHYHGKCENLHGHNYRVRLWVKDEGLDSGGMIVDFALLKRALQETLAALDHTNLNDKAVFHNDPSAERIAKYIYDKVSAAFDRLGVGSQPCAVDVFETSGSMARYEADTAGLL